MDAFTLDVETHAVANPEDHRDEIRLWLRLLTCTTLIEGEIRRRLRTRFGVTLPRFDLMAQLERAPTGLTLSELSQRMMVSNGNLTGLVERLVASGHITRRVLAVDRRTHVITLTPKGRADFEAMTREHEDWITAFFGELSKTDQADLMRLLAKTKSSARRAFVPDPIVPSESRDPSRA